MVWLSKFNPTNNVLEMKKPSSSEMEVILTSIILGNGII
jgi:hypothetical protein